MLIIHCAHLRITLHISRDHFRLALSIRAHCAPTKRILCLREKAWLSASEQAQQQRAQIRVDKISESWLMGYTS